MGFLNKLFGGPAVYEVLAPVAGEAVSIHDVSDPTFGEEILGKGVAIRPTGNSIVSPCDGTVDMMFETGHAVSLTSDAGAEILIHVGLDTVKLKGEYFTVHAKSGDKVKAGQLLIEFDGPAIAAAGYDIITPIVVCNSDNFAKIEPFTGKTVAAGDKILSLQK